MTTWNSGPYPPQDPNQAYYAGQPGYPPQQPGYPPQQPYPGAGYPPPPPGVAPGGYPGGYPNAPAPGFQPTPHAFVGGGGGDPYNTPHQGMYGGDTSGYDEENVKGFDFSDKSIRRGFIRKVYSILMVQLTITLGFIALFVYHDGTRKFVEANSWLFFTALIVMFASLIALACCGEVRRKAPMNFILLFAFTLAESLLLAITSAQYDAIEVLMAVGITAAVCLALTLFAMQTKYDFTMCGGILLVAFVIIFIFGIVAIFVHNKIVSMVYASLGAMLFSIYLIYDTQMMMGGKHKYSISPEEYVFAALNLYVDIINIFIYILTIIGASRD